MDPAQRGRILNKMAAVTTQSKGLAVIESEQRQDVQGSPL